MEFVFELSGSEKGREIITSNDRLDYHVKANRTKLLRTLAYYEAKKFIGESRAYAHFLQWDAAHRCGVTVTVYSPSRRRCDPDNFQPTAKALMDGLTDAGVWSDDSYEVVAFTKYQYGGLSGSKRWKLVLEIEEVIRLVYTTVDGPQTLDIPKSLQRASRCQVEEIKND